MPTQAIRFAPIQMAEKIPADEYARKYGFRTSAIVYRIKAGILDGVNEDGEWFVVRAAPAAPRKPRPKPKPIRPVLRRWLAPRYDEITLFVMGIASVLLFLSDAELRSQIAAFIRDANDGRIFIALTFFLGGLIFSVYHAFVEREKSELERLGMLCFAVFLQAGSAMAAGAHLLDHASEEVHWIFPLWNILSGLLLFTLWRFEVVDTDCIEDDDASRPQVLVALLATYGLVLLGHHILEYHWTLTLSMSVALASTIGQGVDRFVLAKEKA